MDQALTGPASRLGEAGAIADGSAPYSKEQPAEAVEAAIGEYGGRKYYAGKAWSADHALNVRLSIPLGFAQYYITVIAGQERRTRARVALDRRQHPLDTPGNTVFLAFVAVIATAGCAALFSILLAQGFQLPGRLFL